MILRRQGCKTTSAYQVRYYIPARFSPKDPLSPKAVQSISKRTDLVSFASISIVTVTFRDHGLKCISCCEKMYSQLYAALRRESLNSDPIVLLRNNKNGFLNPKYSNWKKKINELTERSRIASSLLLIHFGFFFELIRGKHHKRM